MTHHKRFPARVKSSDPVSPVETVDTEIPVKTVKSEAGAAWFIRTGLDFLDARATDLGRGRKGQPLGDQHIRIIQILDGLARGDPYCYPSNDLLAAMAGKTPRVVQTILEDLEAAGWIKRVPVPGSKKERAGIVMLRRVDPKWPVANDLGRLAEAEAALLGRRSAAPARALKTACSRALKTAPCAPARALKTAPELESLSLRSNLELDSERPEGSRINDNDSESVRPESTGDSLRSADPGLREGSASRNGKGSPASRAAHPASPADPAPGDPDRTAAGEGQSASTDPSGEATAPVRANPLPDPALEPPAAPSNQTIKHTDIQIYGNAGNREFIESLTPERRAKLDRIPWGRRDDILRQARLDLAKGKPARRSLDRLDLTPEPDARPNGVGYPPADATTAELLEALPAVRDASIVPKVARLLMDDLGDKPGSWPCIHGLIDQVWRGHAPAAALAEPYRSTMAQLADRRGQRPIANPAAYFIESVKKWVHDHYS